MVVSQLKGFRTPALLLSVRNLRSHFTFSICLNFCYLCVNLKTSSCTECREYGGLLLSLQPFHTKHDIWVHVKMDVSLRSEHVQHIWLVVAKMSISALDLDSSKFFTLHRWLIKQLLCLALVALKKVMSRSPWERGLS
jgi:hypothetical protein